MADGTAFHSQAQTASLTLAACADPGVRLHARCRVPGCGAEGDVDPAHWLAQGLGWAPVRAFETRLRCACGARRATLQVQPNELRTPPSPGPIHIFR